MENPTTEEENELKEVLTKAELPHFLTVFKSNGVTFELLPKLTHEDLKSIGMNRLVDRINLFKAVTYHEGNVSKGSTPSPLSELESNFLRATHLAYAIIPRAIRIFFDSRHPPINLIKQLDSKEGELKSCKAVYKENYPLLFSSHGCTMAKSENFDLTLLMALLRNFTKIKEPVTTWNKMPKQADTSEGADLVRIRFHRNALAHNTNATLSNKEFHDMWDELKDAGSRLSGGRLNSEIDAQKCAALDDKNKEILHHLLYQEKMLQRQQREIKNIQLKQSDRIPPNIKDLHLEILSRWKTEDKPFIETQAYFKITDIVDQYTLIFIIGRPGEGKSAIARHIALQFEQNNYEVIPFTKSEEIFTYKKSGMKQIFVSDDIFGIFGVHESTHKNELDNIFHHFTSKRNDTQHLKIVFTCRKMVYNELSDMYPRLAKYEAVCDISDKSYEMNDDERRKIFASHCFVEGVESTTYRETLPLGKNLAMFPFMCKLFSKDEKFREYGTKLFTNSHECLLKEIDSLMVSEENVLEIPSMPLIPHCRVKYAALVLCMLKRNELSENVLNDKDYEMIRNEICKNCKIKSFSSWEFSDALHAMEGTYITKSGNVFSFIHDSLLEVVACHYGRLFPDQIALYQSSSYIANNVTLYESEALGALKVFLKEDYYPILAARIFIDIKALALYDVFTNDSLHHERFCKVFLETLDNLPSDELMVFVKSTPLDSCTDILHICNIISWKEETDRQYWRDMERQKVLKMPPIRPLNWVLNYGHHRIMQKLFHIVSSSDLLTNDEREQTRFLVLASYSGNKKLVRTVMKHVPNRCWNMHYGLRTPLTAACEYGHLDVIETLLQAKVDVNCFDGKHDSPLLVAAELGNNFVAEILLKYGADCNKFEKGSRSPLAITSELGHQSVLETLLKHNARCSIMIDEAVSPLHEACGNGHLGIVKCLLKQVNINLRDCQGRTPIFVASQYGHKYVVELLLTNHVDVNIPEMNDHKYPIHIASETGHYCVVKMLIEHGADVNVKDRYSQTSLHLACTMGHSNVVMLLISSRADCNIRECDEGNTPLHIAYDNYNQKIIAMLLENCPSTYMSKNLAQNILDMGIKEGNQSIVQMIIGRDIDINLQNRYGQTPVHVACRLGVPIVLELLLKKNPNCNIVDIRGSTPLHYSLWMGNTDVTKVLLKYENGRSNCQGNRLLFNILVSLQHVQVALDARDVPTIIKIRTYSKEEFSSLWKIIKSENSDKLSHLLQICLNANQHVSVYGEVTDGSDYDDKMSLLYIIACTEECVQTREKFRILLQNGIETQERNFRWKDFFPDIKLDFVGNRKCVSLLECLRQSERTDLVTELKKRTRRYSI